ncbi:MAG: hypothetical protein Q8P67_26750 [archaeon]|nr:hypothetical protein [archaeon]
MENRFFTEPRWSVWEAVAAMKCMQDRSIVAAEGMSNQRCKKTSQSTRVPSVF